MSKNVGAKCTDEHGMADQAVEHRRFARALHELNTRQPIDQTFRSARTHAPAGAAAEERRVQCTHDVADRDGGEEGRAAAGPAVVGGGGVVVGEQRGALLRRVGELRELLHRLHRSRGRTAEAVGYMELVPGGGDRLIGGRANAVVGRRLSEMANGGRGVGFVDRSGSLVRALARVPPGCLALCRLGKWRRGAGRGHV